MNETIDTTVAVRNAKFMDELNRLWSQTELVLSAASTMQDRIRNIYEAAGFEKPESRVTVPFQERPIRLARKGPGSRLST